MLESLKKVGTEIGKELNRAWENLAEGWRELLSRSGDALTHFTKRKEIESIEEDRRRDTISKLGSACRRVEGDQGFDRCAPGSAGHGKGGLCNLD